MVEMPTYADIMKYLTAVFICYTIRVYISFLWHKKTDNKDVKQTNDTNIALFLPPDNASQTRNIYNMRKEENNVLKELLWFISRAEKSVDICMYSFTIGPLLSQITKLHKNNVLVRVITNDFSIQSNNLSFAYKLTNDLLVRKKGMKRLAKAGIGVRYFTQHLGYMHNKFVIIDNKLLINGSLNWTTNALHNNYEDCIITSDHKLVSIYWAKFNQFWDCLNQSGYVYW